MNFIKTSFYSAISSGISILTKLITQKIIAVYLGTQGMFLLGQLKDFLRLSQSVGTLGTTSGIIKYTAEFQDKKEELSHFLSTAFKIHIGFSALIFLFTLVFNEWLSFYLFDTSQYSKYLVLLTFSLISISIHTLFMSILNGMKQIKLYISINIIATLLSAFFLIYLVINKLIEGAFLAFSITQILSFGISFALILIYKPFSLKLLFGKFHSLNFKKLSKYSLMAIVAPLCLIGATFFVRNHIETTFDTNYAGSWEGLWRISAMFLLFLTTTFKLYLLPTFSKLEGEKLKFEVFKIWKIVTPFVISLALIAYLLKDTIITLFLSKNFLLISSILGLQLLGDVIKINCWVLGNILLAKEKTKFFIFLQIEWAIVFSLLSIVFLNLYGFKGVAMAYLGAYIIHFIIMNIYFRKLLWIPVK
jgi:PST family polysaccharide transporter